MAISTCSRHRVWTEPVTLEEAKQNLKLAMHICRCLNALFTNCGGKFINEAQRVRAREAQRLWRCRAGQAQQTYAQLRKASPLWSSRVAYLWPCRPYYSGLDD